MSDIESESHGSTFRIKTKLWVAIAMFAVVPLSACVWGRHLIVMHNINGSMAKPTWGLPVLICAGVAHTASVHFAYLIALAPLALNRRILLGTGWLGAVMIAFNVGNLDRAQLGNVMLYSEELIYGVPIIALGWLIPFSYLHWFHGWRLEFPGSEHPVAREKMTVSTLLLLTLVVSICFFSSQFSTPRYVTYALIGMSVTAGLGFFLAIAVWLVMRARPAVLAMVVIGGIACYYLVCSLFFRLRSGQALENLMLVSAILLAMLSGFIIFRANGGELLTGRTERT